MSGSGERAEAPSHPFLVTANTFRYVDSDDLELMVDVGRLRVSTGFVYNEKALRKLVPNRPRILTGNGVGEPRSPRLPLPAADMVIVRDALERTGALAQAAA